MENLISSVLAKQKQVCKSKELLDINLRTTLLKQLKNIVKENENRILRALNKDLHKSKFEAYITEIAMVYEEINFHIKNISKWSKPKKVRGSLMTFPSKQYIYKEPYGSVLIISPFNYPFQLAFLPLIGAISAGNTVIIKPSEHSTNTSELIAELINENFNPKYIKVIGEKSGRETVNFLLDEEFDYIFFTGSVKVGKIVMEKASKRLIPVTLELGGKSPCIIDKNADLNIASRRIVWGKLMNCGQTCIAPDYFFVHRNIKEEFLSLIKQEIEHQYGIEISDNKDYPRIINKKEFERIIGYIKEGNVYYGGKYKENDLFIEPTILTDINNDSNVLSEEIFGPVFPIIEFTDINECIEYVNKGEKPLALYYFSNNKNNIDKVVEYISCGGVAINDTVLHIATTSLPFGGVGQSGMGNYHGKFSFDTFSHDKSVLKANTLFDFKLRYAPFDNKLNIIRKLFR